LLWLIWGLYWLIFNAFFLGGIVGIGLERNYLFDWLDYLVDWLGWLD
jgi:hypothetical protein